MAFDAADFLENLFSSPTVAAVAMADAAVSPEPIPRPEAADAPADHLAALPFADWVRRLDCHGRMGWESSDPPEAIPFDDLLLPGPACPVCGSLEVWTDLLGRQRCGVCERGILEKAMRLVEQAARLRNQISQQEPTPRIAPCCVSGGIVDTLDLNTARPLQGHPRGFDGASR
jgi:hypothetical protein